MNGRTGRNNMDGSLHNEMAGTTEETEAIKLRKTSTNKNRHQQFFLAKPNCNLITVSHPSTNWARCNFTYQNEVATTKRNWQTLIMVTTVLTATIINQRSSSSFQLLFCFKYNSSNLQTVLDKTVCIPSKPVLCGVIGPKHKISSKTFRKETQPFTSYSVMFSLTTKY